MEELRADLCQWFAHFKVRYDGTFALAPETVLEDFGTSLCTMEKEISIETKAKLFGKTILPFLLQPDGDRKRIKDADATTRGVVAFIVSFGISCSSLFSSTENSERPSNIKTDENIPITLTKEDGTQAVLCWLSTNPNNPFYTLE